MAYAAFADAPIDVAVVEVGLGGTWDATNVADAGVAVVTPIDLDHTHLLGRTVAEIAREKAGIIKPGAHAILAGQPVEAAQVLLERCVEMGALPQREGIDFGVIDRQLAVGGQVIRINGAEGPVDDIFLPLHGAHQAANAAQALAAVEAFLGLKAVNPEVVREGFAAVQFPGRMEVVRRSPTVVLDAAHNPHGARAAAAAITEAFGFTPLVGVVAVMADKDARGLLTVLRRGDEPGRGHPGRLDLPRAARPRARRAGGRDLRRRAGHTWPPGWTTRSSWPSTWPRPTAPVFPASWSPARWSPWGRRAPCWSPPTSRRPGRTPRIPDDDWDADYAETTASRTASSGHDPDAGQPDAGRAAVDPAVRGGRLRPGHPGDDPGLRRAGGLRDRLRRRCGPAGPGRRRPAAPAGRATSSAG